MADLYIGAPIGSIDGMSDQLTVGSTSTASLDVEVRIKNGTTAGSSPQTIEVNKILELVTLFMINHGVDFNATPTSADL